MGWGWGWGWAWQPSSTDTQDERGERSDVIAKSEQPRRGEPCFEGDNAEQQEPEAHSVSPIAHACYNKENANPVAPEPHKRELHARIDEVASAEPPARVLPSDDVLISPPPRKGGHGDDEEEGAKGGLSDSVVFVSTRRSASSSFGECLPQACSQNIQPL